MTSAHHEWITVAAYQNMPGRPRPMAAARA
ncbi:hypothetical protein HDA42_001158 [Streptomyces costaricanus]|uniref:Uncharacterized protein n=1 Tax=Streptomyces murinus TaxID=33900 RepID=A0A7W3NK38_STRMR|nr:hypothetical protein [Streptomyces murinus]